MKLSELIEKINHITKSPMCGDPEVVVSTSDGGLSGTNIVKVDKVGLGFDWNNGQLMLYTDKPVVRKKTQ